MGRILCAWSPNWAIATWKRRNPCAAPAEAFALVAAEGGTRRLTAVDAGAAALGLFAGQKAADAAALAPDLVTAEADPAGDLAALEALAEWCARFSPAVAVDAPDGLFLDITGTDHLWGGEAAMAADLTARLGAGGIPVRTAIADTPGAAWALARFAPAGTIADPDGAAGALAGLPVAGLRLPPATTAQIGRLGILRIGALAALPRAQITRRFGAAVEWRLDQALGRAPEALAFRRPPTPWFARLAFAEPISAPADIARAAADILHRLCAALEARGRGARRFEVAFHRLDGVTARLGAGLALPGRDAAAVARLFAGRLDSVDPGFGIEAVTASAEQVEALAARQAGLEGPGRGGAAANEVAPLVDRLTNRLGEAAVWRDAAWPSWDPERAVRRCAPLSAAAAGQATWDPDRPRPLRLFRQPELIEALAVAPDDPPVLFRWRGFAHRVRRAEGPERLAQEWWRRPFAEADPGQARDYYRVEDDTGARYWLYRDGPYREDAPPRWWMHGLFG